MCQYQFIALTLKSDINFKSFNLNGIINPNVNYNRSFASMIILCKLTLGFLINKVITNFCNFSTFATAAKNDGFFRSNSGGKLREKLVNSFF